MSQKPSQKLKKLAAKSKKVKFARKICFCCRASPSKLHENFIDLSSNPSEYDLFCKRYKEVVGLKPILKLDDDEPVFPHIACKNCIHQLELFLSFKRMCINNRKKLHKDVETDTVKSIQNNWSSIIKKGLVLSKSDVATSECTPPPKKNKLRTYRNKKSATPELKFVDLDSNMEITVEHLSACASIEDPLAQSSNTSKQLEITEQEASVLKLKNQLTYLESRWNQASLDEEEFEGNQKDEMTFENCMLKTETDCSEDDVVVKTDTEDVREPDQVTNPICWINCE